MDDRLKQLTAWVEKTLGIAVADISPASSDASFRRYFRVRQGGDSYVVMDAPPAKEDCGPFIKVSAAMATFGLHVPVVLQRDLAQGFLLLTDLGERQYLQVLNADNAGALYGDAMAALVKLQAGGAHSRVALPPYGRKLLMFEMGLFKDWLLDKQLGLRLSPGVCQELEGIFIYLADQALAQPRVWVHRDYHSRNLMVTDVNNPGVLDFQDAVAGPLSYDLVSLLKDCYIRWPRARVEAWVNEYFARLAEAGLAGTLSAEQLLHWVDLMGTQRHLKAAGIFARLNKRDAKPGYLQDIPRTLGYVCEAAQWQPRLRPLADLLQERVLPALDASS